MINFIQKFCTTLIDLDCFLKCKLLQNMYVVLSTR